MQPKAIKRTLASVGLSLLTAFLSMIVVLAVGDLAKDSFPLGEEIGQGLLYALWAVLTATACFFICRHNPGGIWYVPICCNIIGIISAVVEPNFWTTPMWMFVCGGWILSVLGAIKGARRGVPVTPNTENKTMDEGTTD